MHPEQMLQRAPHSPMAGTGWLHGWRLTFGGEDIGWEGALATLVEDPGAKVFVVLYDMTKEDERNLDRWEGSELGFHQKIRCRVERLSSDTTTDPVLAWLYVLDAWEGGIPSARYLGVMRTRRQELVHDALAGCYGLVVGGKRAVLIPPGVVAVVPVFVHQHRERHQHAPRR